MKIQIIEKDGFLNLEDLKEGDWFRFINDESNSVNRIIALDWNITEDNDNLLGILNLELGYITSLKDHDFLSSVIKLEPFEVFKFKEI